MTRSGKWGCYSGYDPERHSRSEQDELMKALEQMVSYLRDAASLAEKISNKELQVEVTPKSVLCCACSD